ncbi:MAG TPA: AAA family ATPase [Planctomycetota bacterium]|nr:AAA family ATPase [Planctomycetota bacterium]
MLKIAVINQKGGVGKTTTTANLGAALACKGKRVLLIDMDPQANLTLHVDRRPDLEAKTMTNVLVDDAPLREVVVPTSVAGLDIAPADTSLAGVEQVLANRIGRETILREAFLVLQESDATYDFVLLDCPPSLGVLSANALVAADRVLVPVQTEYFALQGMAKLFEVIELVKKRLNPELAIAAILPCMVDLRTNLTAEVLAEIERHFGRFLARSFIRSNVKLAEAPSFGRTIFEHAPDSNGAQDYLAFAAELLGEDASAAASAEHERTATPPATPAPAERAATADS